MTVTLVLHGGSLTATYRPDQAGFHLYSAALPPGGVDGLGRPTVLATGHGLTATGPAIADRKPITLHEVELGVDLPVYPEAPPNRGELTWSYTPGEGVPRSLSSRAIPTVLSPLSRAANIQRTVGTVTGSISSRCRRRPHAACIGFG